MSPRLLRHHMPRILELEVGDKYAVEGWEIAAIKDGLSYEALGGRRFRIMTRPSSYRVSILRERDSADQSLIDEQREFQRQRGLAADRQNADQAANMARVQAGMAAASSVASLGMLGAAGKGGVCINESAEVSPEAVEKLPDAGLMGDTLCISTPRRPRGKI